MAYCKECKKRCDSLALVNGKLCYDCWSRQIDNLIRETSTVIDQISAEMTTEAPEAVAVVVWDRQKKTETEVSWLLKLPGYIAAAGVGGHLGEAIGYSTFMAGRSYNCSCEFGILLINKNQILIDHCTVPLAERDGLVDRGHLEVFRQQMTANATTRKAFAIEETKVTSAGESKICLAATAETLIVELPKLYVVPGKSYQFPDQLELLTKVSRLGSLPTAWECARRLCDGEDPISERQFQELEDPMGFVFSVVRCVTASPQRDEVIRNLPKVAPSIREPVLAQLKTYGAAVGRARVKLVVWSVAMAAGLSRAVFMWEDAGVLWMLGSVVAGIGSIAGVVELRRRKWCRHAFPS